MCLYLIAFHQSQKTNKKKKVLDFNEGPKHNSSFFFALFLNLERLALLFSLCLWLLVSSVCCCVPVFFFLSVLKVYFSACVFCVHLFVLCSSGRLLLRM